jgi:hypothetical protein
MINLIFFSLPSLTTCHRLPGIRLLHGIEALEFDASISVIDKVPVCLFGETLGLLLLIEAG